MDDSLYPHGYLTLVSHQKWLGREAHQESYGSVWSSAGANFLWSLLFFGLQSPLGGLIDILVLLALIIGTILSFRNISLPASYLLIPYLCWVSFATLVNAAIVILN
jgi:tryptophan-rich sensory protein